MSRPGLVLKPKAPRPKPRPKRARPKPGWSMSTHTSIFPLLITSLSYNQGQPRRMSTILWNYIIANVVFFTHISTRYLLIIEMDVMQSDKEGLCSFFFLLEIFPCRQLLVQQVFMLLPPFMIRSDTLTLEVWTQQMYKKNSCTANHHFQPY